MKENNKVVDIASFYENAKNVQIKHSMADISKNKVFTDTYLKSEKVVNKFVRIVFWDLYTLFHNLEGFVHHIELRGGGKLKR